MKLHLHALVLGSALAAAPAAAHVDVEGPSSSGANDSVDTAQPLPPLSADSSATVFGWIDANNENDVDFYTFTLTEPASVYLDVDFAEDAGVAGDADVGLDPELWVFDPDGKLIAVNDDSDFFEIGPGVNAGSDPGSDPWADHDPFIGELALAAGTYHVAVTHYANDANASFQGGLLSHPLSESGDNVIGATADATFDLAAACGDPVGEQCVGPYQLQIRLDFGGVTDMEGPSGSGLNDSVASAQPLGTLQTAENGTLTGFGWIDATNVNDVDFWTFELPSAAGVYLDVDFAEDIRANSDDDVGLDPELWVFDSTGVLIANNDDSDFFEIGPLVNAGTDPGSDAYADHDPFVGELALEAGSYTVAVAYFANNSNAIFQPVMLTALSHSGDAIEGATSDDSFGDVPPGVCDDPVLEQCVGPYQLQVRAFFVPEPGVLLGQLAAGLAVATLAGTLRRLRPARTAPHRS